MVAQINSVQSPNDRFLEMLPLIRRQATIAFRDCAPEVRGEFIQEVVASAYAAFARLVERGKLEIVYATPLAQYAIKQARVGRRVGGSLNGHDVTSRYARMNRGIVVESLDTFDDSRGEWQSTLVEDRRAGPAETAAARIDFAAWLRSLTERQRRIANTLAAGETTKDAAKVLGVRPSCISHARRKLQEAWLNFQGEAPAGQSPRAAA